MRSVASSVVVKVNPSRASRARANVIAQQYLEACPHWARDDDVPGECSGPVATVNTVHVAAIEVTDVLR